MFQLKPQDARLCLGRLVPQDSMQETLPPKSPKSQLWVPTFSHIYTSPGSRGLESLGSPAPCLSSQALPSPCPSPTRPPESPHTHSLTRARERPPQAGSRLFGPDLAHTVGSFPVNPKPSRGSPAPATCTPDPPQILVADTWSRSVMRCPAKTVPKPPFPSRGPSRYSASNASRSLPPTQAEARKSGWPRAKPRCDPPPSPRVALHRLCPPGLVAVKKPRSPGGGVGVTGATASP